MNWEVVGMPIVDMEISTNWASTPEWKSSTQQLAMLIKRSTSYLPLPLTLVRYVCSYF